MLSTHRVYNVAGKEIVRILQADIAFMHMYKIVSVCVGTRIMVTCMY